LTQRDVLKVAKAGDLLGDLTLQRGIDAEPSGTD
jgi:hypothetical protein